MNQHEHDETLYRVAADTLESLALMFLVPEDESPQPRPSCNKQVAVTFSGPFDGALVLATSGDLLPELAANMLGLENGCIPSLEQQEDALKEMANVVCGNVLPAIAGKEPVFHVSAPTWLADEPSPWPTDALVPAGRTQVMADAGALELCLFVDRSSPAPA